MNKKLTLGLVAIGISGAGLFIWGTSMDQPSKTSLFSKKIPYTSCSTITPSEEINNQIKNTLKKYPLIPGAVVAWYDPKTGLNSIASFGESNTAKKTPMPIDAVFEIGSVHKTFKWILLEKLSEQHMFNYTDPINNYVDRPAIPGATIYDLTTHATGMVDIGDNFYSTIWSTYQKNGRLPTFTYDDMMGFLENDSTLSSSAGMIEGFTVGADYHYSSYGPRVATEIIQTITQEDPLSMIEQMIRALGMEHTRILGYDDFPKNLVQGYGLDDGSSATEPHEVIPRLGKSISSGVSGAMFSTGCDLLNYVTNISQPEKGFLQEQTITSRIEQFNSQNSIRIARGFFQYTPFVSGNFWAHGGSGIYGHSSLIAYNPTTSVSVVILANLSPQYIKNDFGFHFDILEIFSE
jgi:CubicO group peptidase (beta-lactamase class C family)